MIKPTSDRAPSTWLLAACGSGAGRVGGRDDDAYLPQLRWPPLSGRGHQPRGLAVLPLPAQPAHGRGDAGRPRHHRQPQDHTAIGAQVQPELRPVCGRYPRTGVISMTTETTADTDAVGLGRGGRMSRQRKRDAVLRLLRGEDLELVSRALGVTAATLSS